VIKYWYRDNKIHLSWTQRSSWECCQHWHNTVYIPLFRKTNRWRWGQRI